MKKKAFLLVVFFCAGVVVSCAQTSNSIDTRITELQSKLGLSEKQMTQIEPVMRAADLKISKLRNETRDSQELMQEMRSIMEQQAKEIEKYLTDEQKVIFTELKKERQNMKRRNRS